MTRRYQCTYTQDLQSSHINNSLIVIIYSIHHGKINIGKQYSSQKGRMDKLFRAFLYVNFILGNLYFLNLDHVQRDDDFLFLFWFRNNYYEVKLGSMFVGNCKRSSSWNMVQTFNSKLQLCPSSFLLSSV